MARQVLESVSGYEIWDQLAKKRLGQPLMGRGLGPSETVTASAGITRRPLKTPHWGHLLGAPPPPSPSPH